MDSPNSSPAAGSLPAAEVKRSSVATVATPMNIDFAVDTVILIGTPTDMRSGFMRLNAMVHDNLGLDLTKERRAVVFFNRNRSIAKVVTADGKGSIMVTRKLREGNFAKVPMRPDGPAKLEISVAELKRILNGGQLLVLRKDFYCEDYS